MKIIQSMWSTCAALLKQRAPSVALLAEVCLLLLTPGRAYSETLTFDSAIQGPPGSFSRYEQVGFVVSPVTGSWFVSEAGAPGQSIQFWFPGGASMSESVTVTAASPFAFESIALYSSVTPIPYTITGSLGAAQVFTLQGTVPNTFGNFRTVQGGVGDQVIDSLLITLTHPRFDLGRNPMGLDNITVFQAVQVPEPPALLLMLLGTLTLALRRFRHGQRR